MVSIIPRIQTDEICNNLLPGFVVGLFEARRTGKTFLMEHVRRRLKEKKILMVQGDNLDVSGNCGKIIVFRKG